MINGIIKLKDFENEILEICENTMNERKRKNDDSYVYSLEHIKESIKYHVNKNLRYNTKTGKVYLGREVYMEYKYKHDIPTYKEDEMMYLLSDAFEGFIFNGASRLHRGYSI